jgi:hypothetical protein
VFAILMAQLWTARRLGATAILFELFGGPVRLRIGRVEVRELIDHTQLIRQLKYVTNRVSHSIADKEQETLACSVRGNGWQRLRILLPVSLG